MKQVNNQATVYQTRSSKARVTNLTTSDVAEIGAKIQEAQAILSSISVSQLAKRAGTTRQNLQTMINRQKKGGK